MRLVSSSFSYVLSLALFLAPLVCSPAFAEEGASRLLAVSESMKALQSEIPNHYLSPEALAESNDYEPEQIVTWIKNNIQFSPSPGYQLTPQASLRTATGNALEQAVLLQNVLVQAGLEVRLAKATLTRDQANTLLKQSFVSSPAKQWELDPALREAQFRHISLALNAPENTISEHYIARESLTPWAASPVYRKAKNLAEDFSQTMSAANAWKADANLVQPWFANAQEYYFVKYRFSQGEPWAEAHPAFTAADPVIEKSSYLTEGIDNQYHTVTVQAFIERRVEGKTEQIPVSGVHKRTTAQLFGQQLQFVTVASGLKKAIEQHSREPLEQKQFFAPTFDGELASNTRYFGLDGRDFSPAEVQDPMGQLGGAAQEKLGEMTGQLSSALGGNASDNNATANGEANNVAASSQLLHYFLQIQWRAPNGEKRLVERTIYRHDPKLALKHVHKAITQRAVLAATPAALTPAAELYEALAIQRSVFELVAKLQSQQYTELQITQQIDKWIRTNNDLMFHAAAKLSAEGASAAGSEQIFSQAPMIAMRWDQQALDDSGSDSAAKTGLVTFDYLINAGQIAVANDDSIDISQKRTLEYGVWSTYAEAMLLSESLQRDSVSQTTRSAAGAFNLSLDKGQLTLVNVDVLTDTKTDTKVGSQVDDTAGLPDALAQRMEAHPEYAFLLPTNAAAGPPAAYYRIHKTTGETLGYTLDGRGSTSAETAMLMEIDIATTVAIGKMISCFFGDPGSDAEVLGCLACGIVQYAVAGIAILRGLSGVVAAASAGAVEIPCNFI